MMQPDIQLFSGYGRGNHGGDIDRLEATIVKHGDYMGFARLQKKEFFKTWKEIEKRDNLIPDQPQNGTGY